MFDDPTFMIGGLLRVPLEYVVQRIMQRLRDMGFDDLNNTNFFVFAHLRRADGLRLVDLARKSNMSKQTMLYLVNQLADRGYVERTPDPADGRAQLLRLTPTGMTLIQAAREVMREVDEEFASIVGEQQFDQVKHSLLQITTAIEQKR